MSASLKLSKKMMSEPHKEFNWAAMNLEMFNLAEAINNQDIGKFMSSLRLIEQAGKQLEQSHIAEAIHKFNNLNIGDSV